MKRIAFSLRTLVLATVLMALGILLNVTSREGETIRAFKWAYWRSMPQARGWGWPYLFWEEVPSFSLSNYLSLKGFILDVLIWLLAIVILCFLVEKSYSRQASPPSISLPPDEAVKARNTVKDGSEPACVTAERRKD